MNGANKAGLVLRDLGGLEEADEQGRLYKVVDEPLGEAHAKEELVRRHAIVRLKSRLAARGAGRPQARLRCGRAPRRRKRMKTGMGGA